MTWLAPGVRTSRERINARKAVGMAQDSRIQHPSLEQLRSKTTRGGQPFQALRRMPSLEITPGLAIRQCVCLKRKWSGITWGAFKATITTPDTVRDAQQGLTGR